MYAIVEIDKSQYKVSEKDVVMVQRVEKKAGASVTFDTVLLVSSDGKTQIGQPYVDKAFVTCQVVREVKSPKEISYVYRRRKSSHRIRGHRQILTALLVSKIGHP
jgi:large subunit ribosomal protein L21